MKKIKKLIGIYSSLPESLRKPVLAITVLAVILGMLFLYKLATGPLALINIPLLIGIVLGVWILQNQRKNKKE